MTHPPTAWGLCLWPQHPRSRRVRGDMGGSRVQPHAPHVCFPYDRRAPPSPWALSHGCDCPMPAFPSPACHLRPVLLPGGCHGALTRALPPACPPPPPLLLSREV